MTQIENRDGSAYKITSTAVGALTKAEAIEFVGGEVVFCKMVEEYGLQPFFRKKTLHKYRVQALNEIMREMELDR